MNLIEFNKILLQPNQIRKDQIKGLHHIITEYPYFQAAHFLHLKGLKKRHSFKYNDFLKKTAAYTTDRSLLFDNITSEDVDIHPAPANLIPEVKTVEKKQQVKEQKIVEKSTTEIKNPEATLGVGKPLNFKSDESYSFREWLQLSKFEPIDRKESETNHDIPKEVRGQKNPPKDRDQMNLIDKFIATNPKINPSLYDSYTDIAMDSVQENESLMTETLAHVYVEQKKYTKAITAFTILSLKYPEKSSFFAHQIQAVKKLQEK